jgi:DNA mismatch repair protein MutS2
LVANLTLSPYGRRRIEGLSPLFDRAIVERRLRQSAQMRDIIRFEEAAPLEQLDDITELVDKSRIEGIHLDPKALLKVKSFLEIAIALNVYGKAQDRGEKFPEIAGLTARLHPRRDIAAAIGRAIDPAGEVLSTASPHLGKIRREIGEAEAQIKQHLMKLLGSRRKHSGWQDDVITIREGRYVIPVLSGDFHADEGIVLDKSQSGATLYVEPASAIPINNRLRQLQQDERVEIDRILRDLTAKVGEAADDIAADLETYGELDAIHALASFAGKIKAVSPSIMDEAGLELIEARHPLLIHASGSTDGVVPLTVTLDRDTQGVLVTGPNTGGKTVALKTIGLLTLMAMTGMEIPADPKSRIGLYQQIYADIGDEQSLELSLSTFSSHIRNIIAAVRDADRKTLVLFDEIGAGTDPKEGAALAEVIILTLLDRGCNLIATTHYSQLKSLPLENPGLLNASLEFDRENLQPTFKLKIGHPGASYAIDIARRLGLPDELADKAAVLLGSEERSLDNLIAKLDRDLEYLAREKKGLEERLSRAAALENESATKMATLEQMERDLVRQSADKLEEQLREGRREIDTLVKSIRDAQAKTTAVKETKKKIDERTAAVAALRKSTAPKRAADGRVLKKGERVWIEKFQTEGEVVEMIGNKKARVAVGSAFMTVDTIDLTRIAPADQGTKKGKSTKAGTVRASAAAGEFNPELMLRGMTVEEALERLDKFLDDAVLAGVGQVYIVHGKGTGTLRKHLTTYLKAHRAVDSIRIGDWNEGGHGVTIARLKS